MGPFVHLGQSQISKLGLKPAQHNPSHLGVADHIGSSKEKPETFFQFYRQSHRYTEVTAISFAIGEHFQSDMATLAYDAKPLPLQENVPFREEVPLDGEALLLELVGQKPHQVRVRAEVLNGPYKILI
jgi:hypothetical protein